jgi:hypothetical protein
MKTLCIVPCGKRKIWEKFPDAGPQKAKDVYIGPYASKCIQYAQVFYPESWYILSAKYGFLLPDDIIPETYEVTFKRKRTNPISINELAYQVHEKGLDSYKSIVVLGGKVYCDIIDILFQGKNISKPLYGSSIGVAIRKLNEAINRGVPL